MEFYELTIIMNYDNTLSKLSQKKCVICFAHFRRREDIKRVGAEFEQHMLDEKHLKTRGNKKTVGNCLQACFRRELLFLCNACMIT